MPRTVRKGLGRYRLAQLRSDLKLTPEARVLEAEQTVRDVPHPEVPIYRHGSKAGRADSLAAAPRRGRVAERPVPAPSDQFQSKLALVCNLLNAEGARYVIVGARALQLLGTTRATKDTDILIEPTLENAARVLRGLSRLAFGVAADYTPEEIISRHATIIGDTPRVDVLTRAWNLTWESAAPRATLIPIEGVDIPTACIEDLIASKRTSRLQDLADIEVLEAILKSREKKSR